MGTLIVAIIMIPKLILISIIYLVKALLPLIIIVGVPLAIYKFSHFIKNRLERREYYDDCIYMGQNPSDDQYYLPLSRNNAKKDSESWQ
jgi:hypothetical protein